MPRFFIGNPEESLRDGVITIVGEDARHISRSLRMKAGESLTVSDFFGNEYKCEISGFTDETVTLTVLGTGRCESEPNIKVTIYQAIPKGDKMDTVVQKCTELGASGFVPVLTSRCISRPDDKSARKKCERWQKIAAEAAKQSGRGIIPSVGEVLDLEKALSEMSTCSLAVMCYECEDGYSLRECISEASADGRLCEGANVAIFIGPEGGISPEEAESASKKGIRLVGLGKRILRTETAPLFAVSAVMLLTGNAE